MEWLLLGTVEKVVLECESLSEGSRFAGLSRFLSWFGNWNSRTTRAGNPIPARTRGFFNTPFRQTFNQAVRRLSIHRGESPDLAVM
jgi:hypothetical protein